GGGPGPSADVGLEVVALPVVGEHGEPLARPDHGVGGVLRPVHALVVGHVVHVPGWGDRGFRLDVGHQHRQLGLAEQPGHPHGRPVGQHYDHDPVHLGVLELAHGPLGVFAVLDRLAGNELAHAGQVLGDLGRVTLLALGDAGDVVVVQVLHDAEDADAR